MAGGAEGGGDSGWFPLAFRPGQASQRAAMISLTAKELVL